MLLKLIIVAAFISAIIIFFIILGSAKASRIIVSGPTRAIFYYGNDHYNVKYSKRESGEHILEFYIPEDGEDTETDWGSCEIWLDDGEVIFWESIDKC